MTGKQEAMGSRRSQGAGAQCRGVSGFLWRAGQEEGHCPQSPEEQAQEATYQSVPREHFQERDQVVSIAQVLVEVIHMALGLGDKKESGPGGGWCMAGGGASLLACQPGSAAPRLAVQGAAAP